MSLEKHIWHFQNIADERSNCRVPPDTCSLLTAVRTQRRAQPGFETHHPVAPSTCRLAAHMQNSSNSTAPEVSSAPSISVNAARRASSSVTPSSVGGRTSFAPVLNSSCRSETQPASRPAGQAARRVPLRKLARGRASYYAQLLLPVTITAASCSSATRVSAITALSSRSRPGSRLLCHTCRNGLATAPVRRAALSS